MKKLITILLCIATLTVKSQTVTLSPNLTTIDTIATLKVTVSNLPTGVTVHSIKFECNAGYTPLPRLDSIDVYTRKIHPLKLTSGNVCTTCNDKPASYWVDVYVYFKNVATSTLTSISKTWKVTRQ
jgi:hypothetical protein